MERIGTWRGEKKNGFNDGGVLGENVVCLSDKCIEIQRYLHSYIFCK